jgi:hypothetical protein
MNLTRLSKSGFQDQLMETHRFGPICFESHYKVDSLLKLNNLKDVVDDFSRIVDFLSNKSRRIFVVFSSMNSLTEDPNISFQIDWKNMFSSLLSMNICFKVILCICDQKSFNNLVVTL